jgi:hypothetical protein
VPGQILIAFVAELKLYDFWRVEGRFAELSRILENDGAARFTAVDCRIVANFGEGWRDGESPRRIAELLRILEKRAATGFAAAQVALRISVIGKLLGAVYELSPTCDHSPGCPSAF